MALWVENTGGVLRVVDGDPEDRPPYRVLGVLAFHGDVAVMEGLLGEVKAGDFEEFFRELQRRGIRWLLAQRGKGHVLPFGRRIKKGRAFAGWFEVDVDEVVNRKVK